MKRTLFIADLHLSENHRHITDALFAFLDKEAKNAETLYILGDMFEVWIGDDEHTPLMDEVAQKLKSFSENNHCQLFYIHGNRDFMIGKRYAKQSGMTLLPEHTEIDLYGVKTLIMHGDTLCLFDKNYQKLRKVLHNPILQFIFNALPLKLRKRIGWKIRTASQAKKAYKNVEIMGVTENEVLRLMTLHKVQRLIHGHTHQVNTHNFEVNGAQAQRFDVGDWYTNLSFVDATPEEVKLVIQPIDYYQEK
ncbi:UDP-2,3-diacylglucosamine diphosphatase [Psychromonas algicola]|uniref:UDP-2,3-diacylglucosamine diphosphatase n=1 Tax=Psychromonas algicola TaxID=2555642 RepID=UPI0010685842|nr:UDP-2,3-diacylglucosamine diphosphatase [Psychromonas sp. RZ5]TEW49531.1 UDP-2,3-diacylglucosamine diphosphatase [Psychromonas sp. RZ5]